MDMKAPLTETRKQLMKLMRGDPQFYEIIYSVDIKGNITIWGGRPCEHLDMFIQKETEEYLHLYDGWKHGRDLVRMERENAGKIPRDELVRAFLDFRKQHPTDGFGLLHDLLQPDDGNSGDRKDKLEVEQELRKRNRQYIFELYGEKLPVDFDFKKDYENRMRG